MHFPAGAVAEINGMRMHCRRIGASKPLGDRSVDEALNITPFVSSSRSELNVKLHSDGVSPEEGTFIVGVRFAVRLPQLAVKALMAPREELPVARAAAAAAASFARGAQEGDDVIVGPMHVSLICPLSRLRPRRAARVTVSRAPAIFDLDFFLEQAARTHKWQCPHTCEPFPACHCVLLRWLTVQCLIHLLPSTNLHSISSVHSRMELIHLHITTTTSHHNHKLPRNRSSWLRGYAGARSALEDDGVIVGPWYGVGFSCEDAARACDARPRPLSWNRGRGRTRGTASTRVRPLVM
jgi:hypothetical protein